MAGPRSTKKTTSTAPITELILWARANGIVLSEVQVGDTRVVLSDLRLAGSVVTRGNEADLKANLYREYGGQVLAEATREDDASSFLEDDD